MEKIEGWGATWIAEHTGWEHGASVHVGEDIPEALYEEIAHLDITQRNEHNWFLEETPEKNQEALVRVAEVLNRHSYSLMNEIELAVGDEGRGTEWIFAPDPVFTKEKGYEDFFGPDFFGLVKHASKLVTMATFVI